MTSLPRFGADFTVRLPISEKNRLFDRIVDAIPDLASFKVDLSPPDANPELERVTLDLNPGGKPDEVILSTSLRAGERRFERPLLTRSFETHPDLVPDSLAAEILERLPKKPDENQAFLSGLFGLEGPPEVLLLSAAERGDSQKVLSILTQPDLALNINATDKAGNTALHWSATWGHEWVAKYLLEMDDLDVNAKNAKGETALITASAGGWPDVAKALLERDGIDINARDNAGNTALIRAAGRGRIETVQALLDQEGIDLNAANKKGETALFQAAQNGRNDVVKLLMSQKAIKADRKQIKTAYQETRNGQIRETIRKAGYKRFRLF